MKNLIVTYVIIMSFFSYSQKLGTESQSGVNDIGWVNLQWPPTANINTGGQVTVYAQIWIDGVTPGPGAGTGISGWIGLSSTNTNPNTWTNWVPAIYNVDVGNNDEFMANLTETNPGTYYYASRFQQSGGAYAYGGYNAGGGGFWDGTTNVSGVLTVTSGGLSAPQLVSPTTGATNISLTPTLAWRSVATATMYILQLATDGAFTTIVFSDTIFADTSATLITPLQNNTTYYWRVSAKNLTTASPFSETWNFKTILGDPVIGWVNLQFPDSAVIDVGGSATVYARIWADGVTPAPGAGAGILGWIGYSTANTNPNTWTNWVQAVFNVDVGNDDEYQAEIGSTLPAGTYYFASRFQLNGGEYKYGGYNELTTGGFWDGTNNISGVLTVNQGLLLTPQPISPGNTTVNVSTTPTFVWTTIANATSYRLQVAEDAGFTIMVFNDSTLTDTSKTMTTPLLNNKTYHWRISAQNSGGSSSFSTTWYFTTVADIGWANLQFPESISILTGGNATFYARVYATGITEPPGQGAGIHGWIGYSSSNTNPNTWTNWVAATYNLDIGNNDEFLATFGSGLPAGTYYVVSRFQLNQGGYKYGGYSTDGGGFWDGTINRSAILNITAPVPNVPNLLLPANNAVNVSITPTLRWTSVSNALFYKLQVATDAGFTNLVYNDSTLTDTTKTLTAALENNRTYYWHVAAKNATGMGAFSVTWSFTTIAAVPGVPVLVLPINSAMNVPTAPTFVWRGVPNTLTYRLQVATDAGFSNLVYNDTTITDTAKTLPNSLAYNTLFYWKVSAKNAGGTGNWSGVWSFRTIIEKPTVPVLALPLNNATGLIQPVLLKWRGALRVEKYELLISTSNTFGTIIHRDTLLTDTSKAIFGLGNNIVYYWKVRAKNVGGISEWSDTWNFKTKDTITQAGDDFVPEEFSLGQNFPNPFNPVTVISYNLPERGYVLLNVFDVLGKRVRVLADIEQNEGRYEVRFEAGDLPSGIYFYSLQAGRFSEIKKMILMK
ncbi:MAG: T9SS type A sorting domain-containing protein [Ignavibacteriaceae bacterium]